MSYDKNESNPLRSGGAEMTGSLEQRRNPKAFRKMLPFALAVAATAFIFGVGCGKNQDRRSQLNLRTNLNGGSQNLFNKTAPGLSAELNAQEFFDKMPTACKTESVKSLPLQAHEKPDASPEDIIEIFDCETMGQIAVLRLKGESAQNLYDGLAIREETEIRQEVYQKLEKLGKTGRPKGRTAREIVDQRIAARNELYDHLSGRTKDRKKTAAATDIDDAEAGSTINDSKSAPGTKPLYKLAQEFACRMTQTENTESAYECIFKFHLKSGTFVEALSQKGVLLATESLVETSELAELTRKEINTPNVSMFQFSGKNPCKGEGNSTGVKMFQINISDVLADFLFEELDGGKGKEIKIEKGFTEELCKETITVIEKRGSSLTCRKSTDQEITKTHCYILGSLESGKLTAKKGSKENKTAIRGAQSKRERGEKGRTTKEQK